MGALTESLRFYLWLFLALLCELVCCFYETFVRLAASLLLRAFFYTHKRSLRVPMIFFSLSPTPPSVSLNRESSV